ncbi:hypothetical protein EV182_008741, partial [Spiromyces aspiralis]
GRRPGPHPSNVRPLGRRSRQPCQSRHASGLPSLFRRAPDVLEVDEPWPGPSPPPAAAEAHLGEAFLLLL